MKIDETTKKLFKLLFDKTNNQEYLLNALIVVEKHNAQERLLKYINDNPKVTISDINVELLRIEGLLKETDNGKG